MPVHTKRREIQLCYPFSESRLLNSGRLQSQWTPPYLVQPKLNGERCRALVQPEGRCLLFSSSAELITTLPHISQQMSSLPPGEYDGELYVHGWTLSRIHSAISTVMSVHPDAQDIQFHIFDLVNSDPQVDRLHELWSLDFTRLPSLHLVRTEVAKDLPSLLTLYDRYISEGYEGFVVKEMSSLYIRRRSPYWMKFKPKQQDVYEILSMIEATSEEGYPLSMVGAFTCLDTSGTQFRVGAGKLSHLERKRLWLEGIPQGSWLLVEYQTLSDAKGVPHFSRAVKVITQKEAIHYEQE